MRSGKFFKPTCNIRTSDFIRGYLLSSRNIQGNGKILQAIVQGSPIPICHICLEFQPLITFYNRIVQTYLVVKNFTVLALCELALLLLLLLFVPPICVYKDPVLRLVKRVVTPNGMERWSRAQTFPTLLLLDNGRADAMRLAAAARPYTG